MSIEKQLANRAQAKIKQRFTDGESHVQILTSSSDWGVVRNGGRRGARHGASSLLNAFGGMISPYDSDLTFSHHEVGNNVEEEKDFISAQEKQAERIQTLLNKEASGVIHLGGGHDHLYPLGKAILPFLGEKQRLHIINLDAHLDTRDDELPHSGTPFRQLAELARERLTITQVGIHPYANAHGNYQNLKSSMSIWGPGIFQLEQLSELIKQNPEDVFYLSLDADAIHASTMEAVSAVNHDGLSDKFVSDVFELYFRSVPRENWIVGIYEYNPLFDNLSCKGARFLASLLYKVFG